MNPEPRLDRRLAAIGLAAMLLLGVAVGMEIYSRLAHGPTPEPLPDRLSAGAPLRLGPASAAAGLVAAGPAAMGLSAGGQSSLMRPALSGDELFSFLLSKRGSPAAKHFAAEFLKEPELAKAWEEFTDKRDVREFVRSVRKAESFNNLLERFKDKRDFKQLLAEAASQPGIGRFVRGEAEAASSAASWQSEPAPEPGAQAAPVDKPGARTHAVERMASMPKIESAATISTDPDLARKLYTTLSAEQASRVRREIEKGKGYADACQSAGLGEACSQLAPAGKKEPKLPGGRGPLPGETTAGPSAPKAPDSPAASGSGDACGPALVASGVTCGACSGGNATQEFIYPNCPRRTLCITTWECPGGGPMPDSIKSFLELKPSGTPSPSPSPSP